MSLTYSLHQLGWRSDYAQQLTLDDFEAGYPARVSAVHRSGLIVLSSRGEDAVVLPPHVDAGHGIAVGDWVLVAHDADRVTRVLPRHSLLARGAAGDQPRLMAANLDALLIVISCGGHINASPLARHLAHASEAGVTPVIVLTKVDGCVDAGSYIAAVEALAAGVTVIAVNALEASSVSQLEPWTAPGLTVALVGSCGAGKSTLFAALTGCTHSGAGQGADAHHLVPTLSGAWIADVHFLQELDRVFDEDGTDDFSVVPTHLTGVAGSDVATPV